MSDKRNLAAQIDEITVGENETRSVFHHHILPARGGSSSSGQPAVKEATDAKEPTYLVSELLEFIGCSHNTLIKYAKQANVQRPGRGARNFRYPQADAIRLLKKIRDEASEAKIVKNCREALRRITS